MNATEFGGDPLCYYLRQSPGMAEISSGKGVIMFLVSYLNIFSLVFLTCEEQVSSILQTVLAPQNPACLCSHRGCWDQGTCQWGKQGINPTLWETLVLGARMLLNIVPKELFCRQRNYFCCLWIASSNLSVPVSSSARSAMGDSSDMSPIPSLTCSLALPTKFCAEQHNAMKGFLSPHLCAAAEAPCVPLRQMVR